MTEEQARRLIDEVIVPLHRLLLLKGIDLVPGAIANRMKELDSLPRVSPEQGKAVERGGQTTD